MAVAAGRQAPKASRRRTRTAKATSARAALVEAALPLFASRGFAATSTRQIATAAGVNISLISYYFGGKEGLRRACAEAIVGRLRQVAKPAIDGAHANLAPRAAAESMKAALTSMVRFLLAGEDSRPIVDFILREMSDPGEAFEMLYGELFLPIHRAVCSLWATATGADPESEQTRISVFAAVGQVIYFRLARPLVQRRLGWKTIGPAQTQAILDVILSNFDSHMQMARGRS